MEKYELTIWTNKHYSGADTDDTVQVMITGENQNATTWETLDHFFLNDFEEGAMQSYNVSHKGAPVGAPVILSFRLVLSHPLSRKLGDGTWMCNKVVVKYKGTRYLCPVYDWITTTEVSFAVGRAILPQQVSLKCLTDMRAKHIRKTYEMFSWSPKVVDESEMGWKLNRFLLVNENKPLPLIFRNSTGQSRRAFEFSLDIAVTAGLNLFKGFAGLINTLDDYKKLYNGTKTPDPYFIKDWMKDTEMGRQVLTGINPLCLKRCTVLPQNCNVTDADVSKSLPAGKTLQSEMQEGKIYIVDHSHVSQIKRNTIPKSDMSFTSADCIGLFYAMENGDLVPIAIQLVPNDETSIFTPHDVDHDWMLAKMYFRSTKSCLHEWIDHFFLTHGVSEVFSVATFRGFPHCHPLYKLLRPHLRGVCKINNDARKVLLPTSSLANKSMSLNAVDTVRHFFKTFDISCLDLPAQLKAQGLDDKKLLPNYPYRDDALDVWSAIETYVTNVIKFYYKIDTDIIDDYELQAWAYDIAHECLGWQDGNTRGMPDKITSVDQLIHICTMIIFSSTAQHAAVNFGQIETYLFVPNAPVCMMLPVHKKGEGTMKRILDSLPGVTKSTISIAFAYALSQYSEDEVFLGDFHEELFVEPEIAHMQLEFKQELVKLGAKFTERNKSLKYPYTYLLPDKIPIDINI